MKPCLSAFPALLAACSSCAEARPSPAPIGEAPEAAAEADPDACAGLALADGFDFPVGPPDATGYYDAQPFGRNEHLASDWNGDGGGDTDFGAPAHSVADGIVTDVDRFGGGWGTVVRIAHRTSDGCVESLYAHLSGLDVQPGDAVGRGDRIGAIGDADGVYWAHLHLEIRDRAGLPLGRGYGRPHGHVDPTAYIRAHRPKERDGS